MNAAQQARLDAMLAGTDTSYNALAAHENALEAKKAQAEEQAQGAFQRALNRGWSTKKAQKCFDECFETWMA
jgi:hypothetical protein